jgi:hypothetical protein
MRTDAERAKALDELIDRQEILDCVYRYSRGVDRLDPDIIRSAYHPGAIDDHGIFSGTVEEFVEWVQVFHRERHEVHHHFIINHLCELDGDVAHTETYFIFAGKNTEGTPHSIHGGRYLDRFERRDGRWAIAARICLSEWAAGLGPLELPPVDREYPGTIARDRTDTSYDRPLRTRQERAAQAPVS